jgi:hypothetical protein
MGCVYLLVNGYEFVEPSWSNHKRCVQIQNDSGIANNKTKAASLALFELFFSTKQRKQSTMKRKEEVRRPQKRTKAQRANTLFMKK